MHGLRAWFTYACSLGSCWVFLYMYCRPMSNWTSHLLVRFLVTTGATSHSHVTTKWRLQVLQLCVYVQATLQTTWLCACGLIRTSSQCTRPLTEYVCVYAVMVFSNSFAMTSTSHFTQLEGIKGGSLYFMKLTRCRSANTQDRDGTQRFVCISYLKEKKPLNPRVPLGPPPAAAECKDKKRVRVYPGRNRI